MSKIFAGIAMAVSLVACGFALWDRNIALAFANINTIVWIGIYLLND